MGRLGRIDKYVAQFFKPSHENMLRMKTNISLRSQISISLFDALTVYGICIERPT